MFKEDLKQAGVNWKKAKAHAANYNQWNMLVPCGKDGSKEDDDTICNIYNEYVALLQKHQIWKVTWNDSTLKDNQSINQSN